MKFFDLIVVTAQLHTLQVNSKKDFNDCTGFEESDDGENGPVTVSFDKVIHHNHHFDGDDDDDDLLPSNQLKS